ncbi:hypothetical protein OH77DRAFT_972751 [Trametes cingulata]|nr:hypothetical protein OH77DRAFT_972751 [Trametes cingulata]
MGTTELRRSCYSMMSLKCPALLNGRAKLGTAESTVKRSRSQGPSRHRMRWRYQSASIVSDSFLRQILIAMEGFQIDVSSHRVCTWYATSTAVFVGQTNRVYLGLSAPSVQTASSRKTRVTTFSRGTVRRNRYNDRAQRVQSTRALRAERLSCIMIHVFRYWTTRHSLLTEHSMRHAPSVCPGEDGRSREPCAPHVTMSWQMASTHEPGLNTRGLVLTQLPCVVMFTSFPSSLSSLMHVRSVLLVQVYGGPSGVSQRNSVSISELSDVRCAQGVGSGPRL